MRDSTYCQVFIGTYFGSVQMEVQTKHGHLVGAHIMKQIQNSNIYADNATSNFFCSDLLLKILVIGDSGVCTPLCLISILNIDSIGGKILYATTLCGNYSISYSCWCAHPEIQDNSFTDSYISTIGVDFVSSTCS